MSLTRSDVYAIIDTERSYQDKTYNPSEVTSDGLTRAQRDLSVAPGIAMLEAYIRKASDAWVNTKGDSTPSLQQIAKIAAIAVRVLERAGGSEKLLSKGLR
jgi:hypothetical protein